MRKFVNECTVICEAKEWTVLIQFGLGKELMNSIFITNPNASLFLLEHNVKSLEEEQILKYT